MLSRLPSCLDNKALPAKATHKAVVHQKYLHCFDANASLAGEIYNAKNYEAQCYANYGGWAFGLAP